MVGLCASIDTISRMESHRGRMLLALLALLLLVAGWLAMRKPGASELSWPLPSRGPQNWISGALLSLWLGAAIVGVFNYYQFSRAKVMQVDDYADATYYYLNSKYFDELGYTSFYEAMLVADHEGPRRLKMVKRYRDLVGYERFYSRSRALSRSEEIKSQFSTTRWQQFQADLDFITRQQPGGWRYFFSDHGFNPPPTWTLLGGALASAVPVESMKLITSIDTLLVVVLMAGIFRVFGLRALLLALVFFVTTFSGRWPILGQALLRFDWVVALVGAVLFLKKGHFFLAGVVLAYAGVSRIFPMVFSLPLVFAALFEWREQRRVPRWALRVLGGVLVCSMVLVGGAWLNYGSDAFAQSYVNLKLHGGPESYSSHRVGLADLFLFRGEWTRAQLNLVGGIAGKRAQLWELNSLLRGLGLFSMLGLALYVYRARPPLHRLIWLGIYPLFIMTTPQINYYNLRLLLVVFHAERFESPWHRVGMVLLLATEVATQGVMVAGADRFCVTATTSIGLSVYLAFMLAYLLGEMAGGRGAILPTPAS